MHTRKPRTEAKAVKARRLYSLSFGRSTGMNGSVLATASRLWQDCCMRIQNLNHSTYQHQYHIVWGTKYRRKYLKEYIKFELLKCLYETIQKYPTLSIETVNVDNDHLHMQIEIPPSMPVAVVVQKMKQSTSIYLKYKFKFIREMYPDGNIWSVGYFSSTIGLNEEQVRKYIEYQGKKDYPNQISFGFA